jgi:hypothetical protein
LEEVLKKRTNRNFSFYEKLPKPTLIAAQEFIKAMFFIAILLTLKSNCSPFKKKIKENSCPYIEFSFIFFCIFTHLKKTTMLKGKKIILGVTGSIAAYKTAPLIRLLVKQGAEVKVIMTPLAKEFITPLTLATVSKNPILVVFSTPPMEHGIVM